MIPFSGIEDCKSFFKIVKVHSIANINNDRKNIIGDVLF